MWATTDNSPFFFFPLRRTAPTSSSAMLIFLSLSFQNAVNATEATCLATLCAKHGLFAPPTVLQFDKDARLWRRSSAGLRKVRHVAALVGEPAALGRRHGLNVGRRQSSEQGGNLVG